MIRNKIIHTFLLNLANKYLSHKLFNTLVKIKTTKNKAVKIILKIIIIKNTTYVVSEDRSKLIGFFF